MAHHLDDDGNFQSDKHPDLSPNVFALHLDDPLARDLIREYARRTQDSELGNDLLAALRRTEVDTS